MDHPISNAIDTIDTASCKDTIQVPEAVRSFGIIHSFGIDSLVSRDWLVVEELINEYMAQNEVYVNLQAVTDRRVPAPAIHDC